MACIERLCNLAERDAAVSNGWKLTPLNLNMKWNVIIVKMFAQWKGIPVEVGQPYFLSFWKVGF